MIPFYCLTPNLIRWSDGPTLIGLSLRHLITFSSHNWNFKCFEITSYFYVEFEISNSDPQLEISVYEQTPSIMSERVKHPQDETLKYAQGCQRKEQKLYWKSVWHSSNPGSTFSSFFLGNAIKIFNIKSLNGSAEATYNNIEDNFELKIW